MAKVAIKSENLSPFGGIFSIIYIRANRCGSLYDDIFALRGWKKEELGGIEFELNSILAREMESIPSCNQKAEAH